MPENNIIEGQLDIIADVLDEVRSDLSVQAKNLVENTIQLNANTGQLQRNTERLDNNTLRLDSNTDKITVNTIDIARINNSLLSEQDQIDLIKRTMVNELAEFFSPKRVLVTTGLIIAVISGVLELMSRIV